MEAEWRRWFQKERVTTDRLSKCHWQIKYDENWEVTTEFSNVKSPVSSLTRAVLAEGYQSESGCNRLHLFHCEAYFLWTWTIVVIFLLFLCYNYSHILTELYFLLLNLKKISVCIFVFLHFHFLNSFCWWRGGEKKWSFTTLGLRRTSPGELDNNWTRKMFCDCQVALGAHMRFAAISLKTISMVEWFSPDNCGMEARQDRGEAGLNCAITA